MTSVLSTLNPLFEKNQTLTKSIYTSFNRSKREGVKKDSANALVNTDETESLHFRNDDLVFDSTSGNDMVVINPSGDITTKGVINGVCTSAIKAANAGQSDTAKALTDSGKTALQNDFDTRYVLQSTIADFRPMQMMVCPDQKIERSEISAHLIEEEVVSLGTFQLESQPSISESDMQILGVFDFFTVHLLVKSGGTALVETIGGKEGGKQGIVNLYMNSKSSQFSMDSRIPFATSVYNIEKGSSATSKIQFLAKATRFKTSYVDGESFQLYYYSANHTDGGMTWKPTVYVKRVIFYK